MRAHAVSLLLLAAAVRAGDEPSRLPVEREHLARSARVAYGLYMRSGDSKIGYMVMATGPQEGVYRVKVSTRMKLESLGQPVDMSMDQDFGFSFEPPHLLVEGEMVFSQKGVSQKVEVVRKGERLEVTQSVGGQTMKKGIPAPDFTLADVLTEERWFEEPRAVGDRLTVRLFDLFTLQPSTDTLEITSVKESLAQGVPVKFYEADRTSSLGLRGTSRHDANGKLLSGVLGGAFAFRLEPEETARQLGEGGDLFVFGLARIDRPLGKPQQVRELVLDIRGEGAQDLCAGPRQSVEAGNGGVRVRTGPGEGESTADEESVRKALEATVDFPAADERVGRLAGRIVQGAPSVEARVERIVRFVYALLEKGVRPEPMVVLDLLDDPRGDCTEHAALFVTLARAAGIPARVATGFMYMGDEVRAFGPHAWAEVVVDGRWIPVDPAWNEPVADGARIRVGAGLEGYLRMSSAFGQIQLELVAVKTE